MLTAINSPFRYPGGKFYARKLILEYIPQHTCYIEPFVGGGSIFFAKNKVQKNWLNDLDEDLINCYLIIKEHPTELISKLHGEPASKERHYFYKHEYQPKNDLERATRWYYLNRTSYSGIMKKESCYWGYGDKYSMRPENWGKNILRTSQKLQDVHLTSLDFADVINQVNDGSFLFVDPPYFSARQNNFYRCYFANNDHLRLRDILQKNSHRINFLLTYDNVPEIQNLYASWCKIYEKEWNYTVNRTDDQKKHNNLDEQQNLAKGSRYKGQELFILNYQIKSTLLGDQLSLMLDLLN